MGGFINVLTSQDRIGGNFMKEVEYKDLNDMMQNVGLFEANMKGGHFTWSNKYTNKVVYYRIDRVIGSVEWFQKFNESIIEILPPHISEHSPLKISRSIQ